MSKISVPRRPRIFRVSVWLQLTEKQKKIGAFMATHFGEELTIRQIKKGAGVSLLRASEITALSVKLRSLKAGVRISCREEGQPYRILWKLD